MPDSTNSLSKNSKEQSHEVIATHVDGNIQHLSISALSASLGDISIMKLTTTNKSSPKYTKITTEKEIILALQYIAKFSNTLLTPQALEEHEQDFSYFIIQQSSINMSAWNSLIDRRLGKIPQEAKIEASIQFDLVKAGIEAQARSGALPKANYEIAPTIPKIHTT